MYEVATYVYFYQLYVSNILLDFKITFEMDHYVIDMNQVVKLLLRYPEVYDGFTIFPINVTVDKVNATATGEF